jgi:putative ABC transport system permease protein
MNWWRRLLGRRRMDRDLDRELHDHLDRQIADYVRDGMGETDARREAAIAFGGLERMKEDCRDARGTRWLHDLTQDIRYGCRALAHNPVFTLVAILSLALGIGANTAIFSMVDGLLLRTLPVREPQRLVLLDRGSWTNPVWEQIRDHHSQLFDGAVAWGDEQFDLAQGGEATFANGLWVSGRFFDVLGVRPILGRTFVADDDRRGGGASGAVAVISHRFWQQRFGGATDAIGRSITLNRVPFTIVGVLPPDFFGPMVGRTVDVAVPIGTEPVVRGAESWLDGRSTWWLNIMARLKPGQTIEQATAALRAVQPQIREATIPEKWAPADLPRYLRDGLTLVPSATGASFVRDRYEQPLLIMMAVVSLVLLIACANIANLLLARASERRHELSVRRALGASPFRLARQLLTESLLLASAGAALGLVFAQWSSDLLIRQFSTPREPIGLDLSLDWRVLGFTVAVAACTALIFGIAPAFRAGRVQPNEVLKEGSRTVAGERRRMLGQPLVIAQVALSLVLVVAAGLFVRTFSALARVDVGFDREPVLLVNLDAQKSTAKPSERAALFERAREAVAAVPGVELAASSLITPVSGMGWNDFITVPGGPEVAEKERVVWFNRVSPAWFSTYGTTLLAGRDFNAHDRPGTPAVAIVNQAFAKKYLNGPSQLGRVVHTGRGPGDRPDGPWQIVGLVEDAAYDSVREAAQPTVYVSMTQADEDLWPGASLSIRTGAGGSPALLTKSVADALMKVDRNLSLTFVPLSEQVNATLVRERTLAMLSGFFGALALLLAAIGLYGVTSYGVSRRRMEIGVRMALGADETAVIRLVLGRVALLVGLGIAAGTALSLWASRFVGSLLYGLEPRDPGTLIWAALVLTIVGALAAWLPARRAARIDPVQVLREG